MKLIRNNQVQRLAAQLLTAMMMPMLALALAACSRQEEPKPRIVWIDAAASSEHYFESQQNIYDDCRRIAQSGFTQIVVDVRPPSGDVLFQSSVAPKLRRVARWCPGGRKFVPRVATFDYLATWIRAGHQAGLKVNAGVNMMVGGWWSESTGPSGMIYDHPERREWCSVDQLPDGTLLSQADNRTVVGCRFLDPANREVQTFLLQMLAELAAYKDLDGIVLDRCRYDDYFLDAGYTKAAYEGFSHYINNVPARWPVLSQGPSHVFIDWQPDSLDVQWLTYRCRVIHDFVAEAEATVHKVAPRLKFGLYVGAWFSEYYRCGVNWASPRYDLLREEPSYWWATPEYQATGFADLVDFLLLGAYSPADEIRGDGEWTMEGFAKLGRKRLCGEAPFAVGPDIGNGKGFEKGGRADVLPEITATLLREGDGLFVFDLSHIRKFDYWDAFQ
ncbi:MAG: family 10 glycosylhydrolase [Bacteroidaceae bacterium]|nr:family 10 glycosylhydrolase [Bacteroidaceae bacterium]